MKKIITFSTIFSLFLLLSSCNMGGKGAENLDKSDYKMESALELYQIAVPKYMKKADDLNYDASLQFQNIFKETYIAIIDEDKNEFVEAFRELEEYDEGLSIAGNYRSAQMDYFTEGMTMTERGTPEKVKINDMNAEQVEFVANVPEVDYDIYYLITFVEGRDDIYMVMQWTLAEYKEKYQGTFHEMIDTFKEL